MKVRLRAPAGLGQLVLVIGVIAGSLYLSAALAPPRQSPRPVAFASELKPGVTTLRPATAAHRPGALRDPGPGPGACRQG